MVEVKSLQRKHLISKENVNASEFPVVQLSYRVKGRFKSVLNLSSFPFDYQTLTVIISSKWSETILQFNDHDPSYISVSHFPDKEEWELGNSVISNTESTSEDNFIALSYSSCHFSVQILRKFSYFLYNIALLMFIITILCFVSFSIESSAVGDKLSVCLTLLLTAVAFKFVVSGSLPPVSYLTILDKYVLSCILFIFLITIVNSVAGLISNKTDLKSFLWYSFYAAVGLFVIMHAIFGVMSVVAVRSRRRETMLDVRQTRQGKQRKGQVKETRISIPEQKSHKGPSRSYVTFRENLVMDSDVHNERQLSSLSTSFI